MLLPILLGLIVVAVWTPVLAQSSDSTSDPLALFDKNKNGIIDADEFIRAVADYLEGRIDATLLMRVRQLYLSTATPPSRTVRFWYEICNRYDMAGDVADGVIERSELIIAIGDFLFELTLTRDEVLRVIECYFSTAAHVVRFIETAYSVGEGTSGGVNITLEMSRPYGTSTVDVPIEVIGGDAGLGDFGFRSGMTGGATTTATFARNATTAVFTVYPDQDAVTEGDETVILGFGRFSTSTTPMDVHPSVGMGTTTVTIRDDEPPPANSAPTVRTNTSGQRVDGGQVVSLDATASDPDGDSLTYSWSGSGSFDDPSALDTMWTAPAAQSSDRTYR